MIFSSLLPWFYRLKDKEARIADGQEEWQIR